MTTAAPTTEAPIEIEDYSPIVITVEYESLIGD
jgi:hypothetical protein